MISDYVLDENHEVDELKFRLANNELYDSFIDRRNAELPDTFVPSARYVAVVDDQLIYLAHPSLQHYSRRGWWGYKRHRSFGTFTTDDYVLRVRRYGEEWGGGETWAVERKPLATSTRETLVFAEGPTPIFFQDYKAAMSLAKSCHPNPREEAKRLCWIPIGT